MHPHLFGPLALCGLGVSFALLLVLYFLQEKFSSLVGLRRFLRIFFVSYVVSCGTFGASYFLAVNQAPTFELTLLVVVGLVTQIFVQVRGESKIRNLHVNPLRAQWDVLRHWLIVILGLFVLLGLNGVFSFVLIRMARQFQLSEIAKDLVLWLQAPIAIYSCQMIFEALRLPLLRYQFHASPLKEASLREKILEIAQKHKLPIREIYLMHLEKYGVNFVIGCKSRLFVSQKILHVLDPQELEFLVVHGLIDSQLNLERQRILNYTLFSLGLVLPYFLAGQGLDYILPSLWALTIWKVLAGLLFV